MPTDFLCLLSDRAGRTLLLGDQRIEIDRDGVARRVGGEAEKVLAGWDRSWKPLETPPEPEPEEPQPAVDAGAASPDDELVDVKPRPEAVVLPSEMVRVPERIAPKRRAGKARRRKEEVPPC